MSDFAEFGIRSELVMAAEAAGFDAPTPVQRAAIPVLRRGGNAVLVASSGSGATTAWVLALLDRMVESPAPEPSASDGLVVPRVLVLTTTEERAARMARTLLVLSGGLTVPVRALAAAWSGRAANGIVVAPLSAAVRGIRESSLKLGAVETLVLDHVSALLESADGPAFTDIAAAIPASAQRVLVTPVWSKSIERFAEAHARRAVTIPPRPADPALTIPPAPAGTISYIVATAIDKPEALARVLRRDRTTAPTILARSTARARWFADELRSRGFVVSADASEADAVIVAAGETHRALIAVDVPFDAESMHDIDPADGLVIIEPRELAHLQNIAREAGLKLKAIGSRPVRGSAAKYQEEIRAAVGERDVDANLALLEPLFEEFSAAEVAAALSALLRAQRAESETAPAVDEDRSDKPMAFVRLFVSAGSRDNIRPGDLVGAITGEASVTGEQVGKIELRDTFAVVEVASDIADRVINAMNGTTLRGRSLRVDYDRKGNSPPRQRTGPPRPRA